MSGKRRVSPEKLALFRAKRKIDQTALAHRLRQQGFGTTQVTISRWENGQEPRAHVLPALAAELGVTVEELYADDDEEEAALEPLRAESLSERLEAVVREIARDEWAASKR